MKQKYIFIAITALIIIAAGLYAYTSKNNGTSSTSEQTHQGVITGNVTYMQRIALPEGSLIEVQLRDISRADAPAEILAEQKIVTTGQSVPIPYTLNYDSSKIVEQNSYAVSARITVEEKLTWISTVNIPVITRGNPNANVEIMVSPANTSNNSTAPANQSGNNLIGTKWSWVRTTYPNKAELKAPAGNKFVLTLKDDKTVSSTTDCNGLGGNYSMNGEVLTFSDFISTLRFCEGSPEGQYSQDLRQTASYVISGNELRLNLNKDAGTMYFAK